MRFGQALARLTGPRLAKEYSPRQFVRVGGGQPIRTEFDATRAIKDGVKKNAWIGAIVLMLAKYGSSVPWTVFTRKSTKDTWAQDDDHPFADLIEFPNKVMSRQFLMNFQLQHLLSSGNALWKRIDAPNASSTPELWPLLPSVTKPVPHGTMWVDRYKDESSGVPKDQQYIPATHVVHAMVPDPLNPLWGMSPLQPLWDTIETDNEAAAWNHTSLENEGVPVGIYSDQNITDPDALAEVQQAIDEKFAAAARKILAIGAGGKFEAIARTAVEMDWMQGRKFNLNQFCAGLGVLPALFDPDSAIYSNLKVAKVHVWTDGVLPLLANFSDAFTTKLIGNDPKKRKLAYIGVDTSGIAALRADMGERVTQFAQLVANGCPINEAIEVLELPIDEVAGGDEPLVQAGLVPLKNVLTDVDPRTLPPESL